MRALIALLLILAVNVSGVSAAWAGDWNFALVGGVAYSNYVQNNTAAAGLMGGTTFDPKPSYGAGLLAGTALGKNFWFETGALYLMRRYSDRYETASAEVRETIYKRAYLTVPAMLRFRAGSRLDVGAGIYGGYALSFRHIFNGKEFDDPYGILGSERWDVGITAALRLYLIRSPAIFVEGRYGQTFFKISTSAYQDVKYRDLLGLAGIQFGL